MSLRFCPWQRLSAARMCAVCRLVRCMCLFSFSVGVPSLGGSLEVLRSRFMHCALRLWSVHDLEGRKIRDVGTGKHPVQFVERPLDTPRSSGSLETMAQLSHGPGLDEKVAAIVGKA